MQGIEKENFPQVVGMTANPMVGRVWRLTEPLCKAEGMDLVHVEYRREPAGRTLRVYLDKPGGVTLDDCVAVSRQLGDILDVGLETDVSYRLEVSSPGVQRPLGRMDDFERFKGRRAKIRLAEPVAGQKNFTGALAGADGGDILLATGAGTVSLSFADIIKAHLMED
ncbi:MAG: ribosome maturation factor RimP [Desulfatitalea sp.]|nr:ribosome maturation factor RimP [Desulfatitalea sp.]NNK01343.1 ribosome maturation factor RimP [Desulfatitalea sp.]